MADKFGGQKDGRQSTGATFYDVPAVPVNANALYFPNFPASPFFGVAEYPVAAGDLGAFSTSGVFVFDKPIGWIDNPGRKVFYRPKTAATGEIVAQEIKGDVFIGYQIIDNINPQKMGVLLASPEFCMNVLMVTSTADSGAGSLRQAIADAQDGDVILFDETVFPADTTTTIYLSSQLSIAKSLTIDGDGRVKLDGQNATSIITTSGTLTIVISDLEIINVYKSGSRGVLYNNGSDITLSGCIISSCEVTGSGVALYQDSGQTTLNSCNISDCKAGGYGAVAYIAGGQLTLNDCTIDTCTAALDGGAVCCLGTSQSTLSNCTFTACTSTENGGAVYYGGTSQNTLTNCTFTACTSTGVGGAVYIYSSSRNTLSNCIMNGCTAARGGAIYALSTSQTTLSGCQITGCSATNGGGVYSGNTSQNTLSDCIFDGCTATTNGGAIYARDTSQNTLTDCVISVCSATGSGGGVYSGNTSQNTLNYCTITGCSATTGGGVYTNNTSQNTLNGCNFDALSTVYVANTSALIISDGITTIAAATLNAASITIADGAALTLTTSATIGAATFTSDGRGYLAVGAGIDISSATLTNVVACSYGAGLESFTIDEDGASWTAEDLTTPILIETRDAGGDWQTLTNNATGGEYATTFALESTARAFDGVAFFVATLPGYWQADAGAVDSNDWSVRGFAAANSNGGGDADAAQGWTVTPSTVTPNADGV